jgi:GAF domain-containing protein
MLALGTFAVGRQLPTDSLDVARTIGAQTVVSYQNIMQLRSTQSQAQQLQQLADFSQSIQARLDIPSILETVSAEAPLILPFDHLSVMMFDTKNQRLYLVAEYDRLRGGKQTVSADFTFNPYTALGGYQEIAGREVLLDGTTAERAWYSRSPLYVRDIARETSLRQTHLTGARAALVELLYSRGVPLGLVEIASPQAAAYTDTDVVIFKQVANQIGIAIENAQAYTQSQRVASSKALVNEISSKLQRQLDMDSILTVTANELGRALGARRARIRLTTTVPDVPAEGLAQSTQQEGTTE